MPKTTDQLIEKYAPILAAEPADGNLEFEEVKETLREFATEVAAASRREERALWTETLIPETLQITMRSRDSADRIDTIRHVITFDDIKHSNMRVMSHILEKLLAKIVTAPVIKQIIEKES